MKIIITKFDDCYLAHDLTGYHQKMICYFTVEGLQELADQIGVLLADAEMVKQD